MKSSTPFADDRLDAGIRRLDPASSPTLTAAEQHHADDLKARILTSAPDANILGRPPVPGEELPRPMPRRRRLVLAGGAVVAVTAGLVAAPLFGDEDRRPTAWSATPTALSGDDARELGEDCLSTAETLHTRDKENRGPKGLTFPPDGSFEPDQRRAMKLVVGEQRGPFALVVLGNARGYDLTCMFVGSSADDDGFPSINGGTYPLLTPARASVTVSGSAMANAADPDSEVREGEPVHDESVSVANGRVGDDVRGVTLTTPAGDVKASVSGGWFAANWPEWTDVPHDPFRDVTITLTLADGTKTAPAAYASFPGRDVPAGG